MWLVDATHTQHLATKWLLWNDGNIYKLIGLTEHITISYQLYIMITGVVGYSIPLNRLYPGLNRPRLGYTPGVYYGLGQFNPTDHRGILWIVVLGVWTGLGQFIPLCLGHNIPGV